MEDQSAQIPDCTPSLTNASTEKDEIPCDKMLDAVRWGVYSYRHTAFGMLTTAMIGAHVTSAFFTTLKPDFTCKGAAFPCAGAEAPSLSEYCDMANPAAEGWVAGGPHTILMEWSELQCKDYWKVSLVKVLFFVGWFVGGLLTGSLCDRYGRRTLDFLLIFASCLILALSSLAPSPDVYLAAKMVHGMAVGGLSLSSYVYGTELASIRYSAWLGATYQCSFPVGIALLVPLAYLVQSWRVFSNLLSLAGLPLLLFWWKSVESPKWLASIGDLESAQVVINKIALWNGSPLPLGSLAPAKRGPAKLGVKALFSFPAIRMRTLVMAFSWFTCSLTYYGLYMAAGDFPGSVYVNVLLLAIMEVPAVAAPAQLCDMRRVGRKGTMLGGLLMGAVFCLLNPIGGKGAKALAVVGKMGVSAAFATVYIWASELFPTDVRTSGMGISTASARVGGMLAPIIADMPQGTSMLIFGAVAFAAFLLDFLLPETLGVVPVDTLEELQGEAEGVEEIKDDDEESPSP